MKKYKTLYILLSAWTCVVLCGSPSFASTIHVAHPEKNQPLSIEIDRERSNAYGWKPGDEIKIDIFSVSKNGEKSPFRAADGQRDWAIRLDPHSTGSLAIILNKTDFTGALQVTGNGKSLFKTGERSNPDGLYWTEKILEAQALDGVIFRVHYNDQALKEYAVSTDLPSEVLDAAMLAYQTITDFQGFNTNGYSFARPDAHYAADPDKAIDIYLGDPTGFNAYPDLGLRNNLFKDAPCFDTIKISETQYQAVILLPVNYQEFIRNWEKINPSPLGRRNVQIDLRGTLIHEMLHVIIFYYNKNMNRSDNETLVAGARSPKNLDWYVEGLARYFETFAGAKHDFYSQGFKQTLPDKIRFSRGGSNYFMRYPDQAFTQLRYENALFWRYLDDRFGMEAIEEMSRQFRSGPLDIESSMEKMSGVPFKQLLKDYARSILLKDFGLKDESVYLNDVARCRLLYKNNQWFLVGGQNSLLSLGKVCQTDWVGSWENFHSEFSEPSVAGDNTRVSDVSGWATDYVEIKKDAESIQWPKFKLHHDTGKGGLLIQVLGQTKGGSHSQTDFAPIDPGQFSIVDLNKIADSAKLNGSDFESFDILVTNSDFTTSSEYSLEIISP